MPPPMPSWAPTACTRGCVSSCSERRSRGSPAGSRTARYFQPRGWTASRLIPAPSGGDRTGTSSCIPSQQRATRPISSPAFPTPIGPQSSWLAEGDMAEVHRAFEGFHGDVQRVLAACPRVHKWALFQRDPLPCWSQGPGRAAWRCLPPDDALHGARRRQRIGGCRHPRALPRRGRRRAESVSLL